MTLKAKDRLEAEVVLRPRRPGGGAKTAITAKSVSQFEADPETVEKTVRKLTELGFEVLAESPTSVSIVGSRALFNRVFKTPETTDATSVGLNVPKDLDDYVEGVYIQAPPKYYQ